MSTISSDCRFSLILAYRLSALLAVVTLIHAAVGAFWPGIFRDPPMTAGNAQGTAVAMLLAALPALVGSMILAARGSLRARLVWLGALSALGAVWLWQRKGWGFLLTGLMLSMLVIETASIALDQWFGHLHDPAASPAAVPIFAALTVIGLVVLVAYLRYLRLAPGQANSAGEPGQK